MSEADRIELTDLDLFSRAAWYLSLHEVAKILGESIEDKELQSGFLEAQQLALLAQRLPRRIIKAYIAWGREERNGVAVP